MGDMADDAENAAYDAGYTGNPSKPWPQPIDRRLAAEATRILAPLMPVRDDTGRVVDRRPLTDAERAAVACAGCGHGPLTHVRTGLTVQQCVAATSDGVVCPCASYDPSAPDVWAACFVVEGAADPTLLGGLLPPIIRPEYEQRPTADPASFPQPDSRWSRCARCDQPIMELPNESWVHPYGTAVGIPNHRAMDDGRFALGGPPPLHRSAPLTPGVRITSEGTVEGFWPAPDEPMFPLHAIQACIVPPGAEGLRVFPDGRIEGRYSGGWPIVDEITDELDQQKNLRRFDIRVGEAGDTLLVTTQRANQSVEVRMPHGREPDPFGPPRAVPDPPTASRRHSVRAVRAILTGLAAAGAFAARRRRLRARGQRGAADGYGLGWLVFVFVAVIASILISDLSAPGGPWGPPRDQPTTSTTSVVQSGQR